MPVMDALSAVDRKKTIRVQNIVQRQMGAYYTLPVAAQFMTDWIVRQDGEHILEPSFGDGVFLRSVSASSALLNFCRLSVTGIEIDDTAKARTQETTLTVNADLHCCDFLSVSPFPVQAVIGNPPYVRLRNLPEDQKERGLRAAASVLKQPMEPSGSIWMPFVLHAMRFLANGGRMALVLPYEITYVRYARPLWDALRKNFGSLRVLRTHERLFPDILQDVIILLADDFGTQTQTVHYQAFEQVQDMVDAHPVVDEQIEAEGIVRGQRLFIEALLPQELRDFLLNQVKAATTPARNLVTFNIGYVTGDKDFFHPTRELARRYSLPTSSLRPSLTSTRSLKNNGLRTTRLTQTQTDNLFLPAGDILAEGERQYVRWGEETGVSNRYKCRVRKPWFLVPGVRVPDLILSVFSERPVLLINDGEYLASNSLLCGFTNEAAPSEIVAGWYTSLTLLQCELEVHALGGGVMVLIPGEAGSVRLPRQVLAQEEHLDYLDCQLKKGHTTEAYQAGDKKILVEQLGFSQEQVELIRQGISVLTHWRTSSRSSRSG